MTLQDWIAWAFEPWPKGRHPFHSFALCRQASRDMGTLVDHDDFVTAMLAAGYKVKSKYGGAIYFDATDTAEKRAYYRKRYIGADDRAQHPLNLTQYPGAMPV